VWEKDKGSTNRSEAERFEEWSYKSQIVSCQCRVCAAAQQCANATPLEESRHLTALLFQVCKGHPLNPCIAWAHVLLLHQHRKTQEPTKEPSYPPSDYTTSLHYVTTLRQLNMNHSIESLLTLHAHMESAPKTQRFSTKQPSQLSGNTI